MSVVNQQHTSESNSDRSHSESVEGATIGTVFPGSTLPMLDQLLQEQQTLTAVEQFSRQHSSGALPDQQQHYSKLLPATPPTDGQQYAFDVDLDRCSGCKACVTACHSLNGLDDDETWRDVGLLVGGSSIEPVVQHVTTACHHCLEPACMTACPVDAYEKDPVTGIVKHLDDQCFGCQYCTLACPYDVPKYHSKKGIVRKCDMCSDRLAVGEAPACVQACPHEAIAINIVDIAEVRENAEADPFLPAAPEPYLTYPTTNYKTTRVFPRNLLPADYYSVNPQHPHWPLIIMLVLTQLSVGAFAVGMWLETELDASLLSDFQPLHALLALVFGLVALGASTMHLGRPLYAFRAVIGLKHSWLSREIVTFGIFAGAAKAYAALVWFGPQWLGSQWDFLTPLAGWTTVVAGAVGVFCSAMIYAFTKREFWSIGITLTKFVLTSVILGSATAWVSILLMGSFVNSETALRIAEVAGPALLRMLLFASVAKLMFEASIFRYLTVRSTPPLKRSAKLMIGPLVRSTMARFAFGIVGGIALPWVLMNQLNAPGATMEGVSMMVIVGLILLANGMGETLERLQFFAAVAAPRMPGNIRR